MYDKTNPLYYEEIFTSLEKLGWSFDSKELEIYTTIQKHPIRRFLIQVMVYLVPTESTFHICFLFDTKDHNNRCTQSFLREFKKALAPRGVSLERLSRTKCQVHWEYTEVELFEERSPKEVVKKILEQYTRGCLFACSYAHIIRECVRNNEKILKRLRIASLVEYCLTGTFDKRLHTIH